MKIQRNIRALNAYSSNYTDNNSVLSKHMEKPTSGLQINRSSNDAASLAIPEKTYSQITGLNRGIENARDGRALCRAADGALNKVHNMLNRLKELSVQANSGTYSDAERQEFQKEADQILTEIDRISEASSFNGQKLFSSGAVAVPLLPAEVSRAIEAYRAVQESVENYAAQTSGDARERAKSGAVQTCGVSSAAETGVECGDFTVIGGTEGIDYTFDEANGVLTILKNTAITIRNTDPNVATTDRIKVAAGVNANITLAGINIDTSASGTAAFEIEEGSTGNVTITLADGTNNTLKSGNGCAGLQKNGDASSGTLTIDGNTGTLEAIGGNSGAGIGSGSSCDGSNIIIKGGIVTAQGGQLAAGIGGGELGTGKNIIIVGGDVRANGGSNAENIGSGSGGERSSSLVIDGRTGTVKGDVTLNHDITIENGVTLEIEEDASLTVGEDATLTNNGTINVNGELMNNGTIINNGTINGKENITGNVPVETSENGTILGDFTVIGGTLGIDFELVANVLMILSDTELIIQNTDSAKTATNRIEVADSINANITLTGVNIDESDTDEAAFKIADGSTGNVTITLADGAENILKSGFSCAGLQKNGDTSSGTLTIKGSGTLTSAGGDNGAGIGGGRSGDGSNITISSGTVTAVGGAYAAGIGGGSSAGGSDITIGGTVMATGGDYAAGIGGGSGADGSDITISGGTVMATGGNYAAGIGGGASGSGSNITISNACVTVRGGNGADHVGGGKRGSRRGITQSDSLAIEGNTGTVTGNATLHDDFTIGNDVTVKIGQNASLTVGKSATLTNNGIIDVDGGLLNDGTFINKGTIRNNGTSKNARIITSVNTNATICGAFILTGGKLREDFTFADGLLTILTETAITIQNTNPNEATTDHIRIEGGVNANITLAGINIDSSATGDAGFEIAENSTGNITIRLGDSTGNILKSGDGSAGLQKNGGSKSGTLIIAGHTGTLTATGGDGGAGIGGGDRKAGNNIIINGNVTARAGGSETARNYINLSSEEAARAGDIDAEDIGRGRNGSESSSLVIGGNTHTGIVNGDFLLNTNLTIDSDVTLEITADASLTVGKGTKLTNNGAINVNGELVNNGTIINDGTISIIQDKINSGRFTGEPPINGSGDNPGVVPVKKFWIPCGSDTGNGMYIEIKDMDTEILGLHGLDITTQDGTDQAIPMIAGAIDKVSSIKGMIGVQQNRLEHTILNEMNMEEYLAGAESLIRDTVVAEEVIGLINASIQTQAEMSLLAQANMSGEGALWLLQ